LDGAVEDDEILASQMIGEPDFSFVAGLCVNMAGQESVDGRRAR
jgi:hypothetical protein